MWNSLVMTYNVETCRSVNYTRKHCCDIYIYIYCYDTNCAFVGYNKKDKRYTVHILK